MKNTVKIRRDDYLIYPVFKSNLLITIIKQGTFIGKQKILFKINSGNMKKIHFERKERIARGSFPIKPHTSIRDIKQILWVALSNAMKARLSSQPNC